MARNSSEGSHARKLKKYGWTPQDYANKFKEQGGVCAICGKPPKTIRLAVDHNHKTGAVRGLLCATCNGRVISRIERYNIDPLKIAAYLDKYKI